MLEIDASRLNRFMSCNGSEFINPDPRTTSDEINIVREEGNAAHWLASIVLQNGENPTNYVGKQAPNNLFITSEIADHVSDYVSFISGLQFNTMTVEKTMRFGGDNHVVNCRSDVIGLSTNVTNQTILSVVDFKFGYTLIEPERNWTMIAYAIAFCIENNMQPEIINITVVQPRGFHPSNQTIRTWSISYSDLCELYYMLSSSLELPLKHTVQTGKHCVNCPAFVGCSARQVQEMSIIDFSYENYSSEMSPAELSTRADLVNKALDFLKATQKEYEAQIMEYIRNSVPVPNYFAEPKVSNTNWNDGVTYDILKAITGKDLRKNDLITPNQALKKGVPEDIVKNMSSRKTQGVKLVRKDANQKASKAFN